MSTTRIALIQAYQAAITSLAKHGTLKNARSAVSAAERAAGSGCVYTWGISTKADFLEYCAIRIADLIAHDHAEALALDRLWTIRNANTKAARLAAESGFTVAQCQAELDAEEDQYFAALHRLRHIVSNAQAEALEMDKQATYFRKEQAALTQRVATIMGKVNLRDINKAPV